MSNTLNDRLLKDFKASFITNLEGQLEVAATRGDRSITVNTGNRGYTQADVDKIVETMEGNGLTVQLSNLDVIAQGDAGPVDPLNAILTITITGEEYNVPSD